MYFYVYEYIYRYSSFRVARAFGWSRQPLLRAFSGWIRSPPPTTYHTGPWCAKAITFGPSSCSG